jgi:serine/threonine protein phosphatase 1
MRIYAIGDVHGRHDLLSDLARRIEADLAAQPMKAVAVFVGDYVDRGPHSAAVLERLSGGWFPTPVIALRGNHEEMFLRFLEDPATLSEWRRNGGLETWRSYGVNVVTGMRGEAFAEARRTLLAALPPSHLQFLRETRLSVSYGDYFFCHAGVRPGVALESQRADDLMWIRDGFLRFERPFGKVVVHGHTPVAKPDVRANRINIDTGAFATSVLTCLALEGTERRFLTVGARGRASA